MQELCGWICLPGLISYNIYYVLYLPFDRRRMNCVWVFSNCPIKHVNILTVYHNHISMFIEFWFFSFSSISEVSRLSFRFCIITIGIKFIIVFSLLRVPKFGLSSPVECNMITQQALIRLCITITWESYHQTPSINVQPNNYLKRDDK